MPAEARDLWVCWSTSLQRPKSAACHMSVGKRRGYKEAVAFGLQGPAEPGSGRGDVGADVWGRHIRQWACECRGLQRLRGRGRVRVDVAIDKTRV